MHRILVLSLALWLNACGSDPAAFGITGPSEPAPPPVVDPTQSVFGTPDTGFSNTPDPRPSAVGSRYWGYN